MEHTRLPTGIDGLDTVLQGGLIADRSYLLHGPAGSGKTIFGFHFLQAGVDAGETALFINLEEDLDDLKANARKLGFDVESMSFLDLGPTADTFSKDESYDIFEPADVEADPITEQIIETIEATDPERIVVDPITQFEYLTSDEYQFRKQIIGFMRFLKQHGGTALFTSQDTGSGLTKELQFITDGTIHLTADSDGRTVSVPKFRGSGTRSGEHVFRITDDGVVVFPELVTDVSKITADGTLSSGIPEVDQLLHGGIERATVSIISGPTGVGKTTLGTQFMKESAGRGDRSVVYLFEENEQTFRQRSKSVNIPVDRMVERGTLRIEEVEALASSPQEFAHRVRTEVEANDTEIVMIDGIKGYGLTLQGENSRRRLHSLGRYLKRRGVTSILIDETSNITGEFRATDGELSYLADNIVFLRHLELQGELRKAIGVLKKRTSDFERTLRRYEITEHGISVGEPLTNLRGILTGTPEIVGNGE
ncbi:MAG: ATPase domain-containing protein [Natronomonas sp.]